MSKKTIEDLQGEGDREAAERYNEATKEFVESGKVEEAAAEAGEQSEEEGTSAREKAAKRAKDLDPLEQRDFDKPAGS